MLGVVLKCTYIKNYICRSNFKTNVVTIILDKPYDRGKDNTSRKTRT